MKKIKEIYLFLKKRRYAILFSFCSLILLLNIFLLNKYSWLPVRIKEIGTFPKINNFFDLVINKNDSLKVIIGSIINATEEAVDKFNFSIFLTEIFKYFMNNFSLIINLILVLYLIYFLLKQYALGKVDLEIKITKSGKALIKFDDIVNNIYNKISKFISYSFNENRRFTLILLISLWCLFGNGVKYLFEILIAFFDFGVHAIITMDCYNFLISLIIGPLILLITWLKTLSFWQWVFYIILFLFFLSLLLARIKLKRNHNACKCFVKYDLAQITGISGYPSYGKTFLMTMLGLYSVENTKEDLVDKILDLEALNPKFNYAKVREDLKNNPGFENPEYSKYNDIMYFYNRGKELASNYPIINVYDECLSIILDFNWFRVKSPSVKFPLEEHLTLLISEADKEFNSHDDKKVIGQEGTNGGFSTFSHITRRTSKIFFDCQIFSQLILRIRDLAETFITIKKKVFRRYPLLIRIFRFPFFRMYINTMETIKKYMFTSGTIKNSFRLKNKTIKRNDFTFYFVYLRLKAFYLLKILNFFEKRSYFVFKCEIKNEFDVKKGNKKTIRVNAVDTRDINGTNLYNTTFLSNAYLSKKNLNWNDLEIWKSLYARLDELKFTNSHFYENLYKSSEEEKNSVNIDL